MLIPPSASATPLRSLAASLTPPCSFPSVRAAATTTRRATKPPSAWASTRCRSVASSSPRGRPTRPAGPHSAARKRRVGLARAHFPRPRTAWLHLLPAERIPAGSSRERNPRLPCRRVRGPLQDTVPYCPRRWGENELVVRRGRRATSVCLPRAGTGANGFERQRWEGVENSGRAKCVRQHRWLRAAGTGASGKQLGCLRSGRLEALNRPMLTAFIAVGNILRAGDSGLTWRARRR